MVNDLSLTQRIDNWKVIMDGNLFIICGFVDAAETEFVIYKYNFSTRTKEGYPFLYKETTYFLPLDQMNIEFKQNGFKKFYRIVDQQTYPDFK